MAHGPSSSTQLDSPEWIWKSTTDPYPVNTFHWFRTVVDLDQAPRDGTLLFAANSTAHLWVNGEHVRRKVTRFAEADIRYDIVNAAPYLKRGTNSVVVLHHSWGPVTTFQRTGLTQAGFALAGDWWMPRGWRWREGTEFSQGTSQVVGNLGPEHTRIRFPINWDAWESEDSADYFAPDFNDSAWAPAVSVPVPLGALERKLVETPAQRESEQSPMGLIAAGIASYESGGQNDLSAATRISDQVLTAAAARLCDGAGTWTVQGVAGDIFYATYDFGRPVHGYVTLDLDAQADVLVRVGYGEIAYSMRNGREHVDQYGGVETGGVVGRGYQDEIRPAKGPRAYELPDERTARWLLVEIEFAAAGAISFQRLGIVKSQFPIDPIGTFECGDERVQQIVKLATIHAEVTMTDAYIDTPGREDGQWIEDARPRALISARWFGDTTLRRLLIRQIAGGQRPDGSFHPFYPSNFPVQDPLWDWSLQWVGMLHDDYMWSADSEFVHSHFSTLARFWVGVFRNLGRDYVWRSNRAAGFVLGDVRTSSDLRVGDSSGLITPWVIDRLRDSARLAEAVGELELAASWSETANNVARAFRTKHLRYLDDGTPFVADRLDKNHNVYGLSQAGQVLPLLDGILDADEAARVIEYAFPAPDAAPPIGMKRWNNPTWSYRVLRALAIHGHADRAVRHLKDRFLPYLPISARNPTPTSLVGPYGGPLPEYWISAEDLRNPLESENDHQPLDPSGSHGWGAVPLLWLHDSLLGVEWATPGGKELTIAPRAGGLPYVAGHTQTPLGVVYVRYDSMSRELRLDIPNECTAALRFPVELRTLLMRDVTSGQEVRGNRVMFLEGGRHQVIVAAPSWE